MPLIDLDDSFNAAVIDSFNDVEENSLEVDVEVEDSFNEDNSVNDSGNLDVEVEGSFNEDSHDTDIDITDSWNTYTDESVNDNSVNAGVREYNTGIGDLYIGGAAAAAAGHGGHGGHGGGYGGGDVHIFSQSTIVDQSVNQNIAAADDVNQVFANTSLVASGDDSVVAGDDVTMSTTIDESTNLTAGGDLNYGNETTIDVAINSGNVYEDHSVTEDNSIDVDVEDSFNDYSDNFEFTDSFNETTTTETVFEVDVDVDAIIDSDDSAILDDLTLGF